MRRIDHWIDGVPVGSGTGRRGPVFDPATGAVQAEVALAPPAEVATAVAAAKAAFPAWNATSLSSRANVLFEFRALLASHADEVAPLVTAEHGKVLSDAAGEVAPGPRERRVRLRADLAPEGRLQRAGLHRGRRPLQPPGPGRGAGITPFNFPAMVPLWMLANAIACGNAFVLKPSEKDPSPPLRLAELLAEAGPPPGVFNVVNGDREAVEVLLDHPDVAAVSFVGSTPVARAIYPGTARGQTGAGPGRGQEPHGGAARRRRGHGGRRRGERGLRVGRRAVHGRVGRGGGGRDRRPAGGGDRGAHRQLRVGPGWDPDSEMGPLITAEHHDKVAGYVAGAAGDGATVVVDGRAVGGAPGTGVPGGPGEGFFLGPCLLDGVRPGTPVYDDEIFGPVLGVVRTDSFDEALGVVNANPYGNGTAIFTRTAGRPGASSTR